MNWIGKGFEIIISLFQSQTPAELELMGKFIVFPKEPHGMRSKSLGTKVVILGIKIFRIFKSEKDDNKDEIEKGKTNIGNSCKEGVCVC